MTRYKGMLFRAIGLSVLLATLGSVSAAGDIQFTNALVIGSVGRAGRSVVHTDAIEAQIIAGQWHAPHVGDQVTAPDGRVRTWETAQANTNGWFRSRQLRGGYAFVQVNSPAPREMVLEAAGQSVVYVNGVIRAGDVYGYSYVHLPVELKAGPNEFLFQVARGRLRAKLVEPRAPVMFNLGDNTLPDFILGEPQPVWGAVVVLNTTTHPVRHVFLQSIGPDGRKEAPVHVRLLPLGLRKIGFLLRPPTRPHPGELTYQVQLFRTGRSGRQVLDTGTIKLRVRTPYELYKRTFISKIDGSVQYYAVNPPPHPVHSAALFLSLHGASVEATGQAAAYEAKTWGYIIVPTNRRPYGFDWEDWGRMDAMEVLHLAEQRYHTDPSRTYLTGHSMGGHGTWHVGVLYPDRFAAIGPSAGWISFFSYVNRNHSAPSTPMSKMLRRAADISDTLLMASNYLHEAIYILHGSKDDNVPVREARTMRDRLSKFHHDFIYHEQPGVGHWWDISKEPGADCVDWPPMFDLFAHHRLPSPDELRNVQFTTVNPGVSSHCDWLTIDTQRHSLEPSTVQAHCDPGLRRIIAHTKNVLRLTFDLPNMIPPGGPIKVELDGQKLDSVAWSAWGDPQYTNQNRYPTEIAFQRIRGHWALASRQANSTDQTTARHRVWKGPHRAGPFKEAFRNRMIFVYGTHGTPAENAWALAKARFDADTFWYRGNGSVDVVPDRAYLANPARYAYAPDGRRRNVILYGNADSNAAWKSLLGGSPVQVRQGEVQIGGHELQGANLACLFVRPCPGDKSASIGVVSGSGLEGMHLTDRLPFFLSGAGFPDCLVLDPSMLQKGVGGVRAAGFFGPDWSVRHGDFVWQP